MLGSFCFLERCLRLMNNETMKTRNQEPVDLSKIFNNETVTISLERYEEMKKRIKDMEFDDMKSQTDIDHLLDIIKKIGVPTVVIDHIIPESIELYEQDRFDKPYRKRYRIDFEVDM